MSEVIFLNLFIDKEDKRMNDIPGRSIDDPVPLWNKVCGLYSLGMREVAPIYLNTI